MSLADTNMVEMTRDYKKLKHIINRPIDPAHVEHLKKEFIHEHVLSSCPVILTSDFYILDGQHRIEACRQKGYPVYYIRNMKFKKDNCLDEIIKRNSLQKKWAITDYMHVYADSGKDEYGFLRDLLQEIKGYINFSGLFEICDFSSSDNSKFTSKQALFKSKKMFLMNKTKVKSFVSSFVESCKQLQICPKAIERCQTSAYMKGLYDLFHKTKKKNEKKNFSNFMQRLNKYYPVLPSTRNLSLAKDKIDYLCGC